jgi:hypothetical protein
MFEWLERELSLIKTPRFHLVDGPADVKLRELVTKSNLPVPSSYKAFILKFGNARLYRNARDDSYRIGVFAGPREASLTDGTRIYHLGFHDGARVYVKPESSPDAFPIFECEDLEEEVANSFEEWLATSCTLARNRYTKKMWAEILHGPKPFTREEEEMIEARRRMEWRVLGIDAEGNHIFEVINTSCRTLPALTIGVHSKDGQLNGAIRLDIGHVEPGEAAVLKADCYKNLVPPEKVELFALPDPQPEDRDYYWEFRK